MDVYLAPTIVVSQDNSETRLRGGKRNKDTIKKEGE